MMSFDFRNFAAVNPIVTNRRRPMLPGRVLALIGLLLVATAASAQTLSFPSAPYTFALGERSSLMGDTVVGTVTATGGSGTISYALSSNPEGKFSVAADTGEVSYIGTTREDVTVTASYALTVRATDSSSDTVVVAVTVNIGICDRTAQVWKGIIANDTTITTCENVTVTNLEALTGLQLSSQTITSLVIGDFAGLSGLVSQLVLNNNQLSDLPEGVFAGLTSLISLALHANQLSALPVGVFDGLSSLEELYLYNNSLSDLLAGVFAGLTTLTTLRLENNSLSDLPLDVFAGLTNLTTLRLEGNSATFTVTLRLEQLEDDAGSSVFRVRSNFPGPVVDVTYQISGGSATVSGNVQVPAGTTISSTFTVPAASGHTTVSLMAGTFGTTFKGFTTTIGSSLAFGTPAFEQPGGYVFHDALLQTSTSGTVIGTVSATDVNADPITYSITAPDDGGNTFSIHSDDGVITYIGSGNETPGRTYALTVTAINTSNNVTAVVAVTISVRRSPQFSTTGPFSLDQHNQTNIGVVSATDPNGAPITYSLVAVSAEVPGTTTAGKFTIVENSGVLSIGTVITTDAGTFTVREREDVTINPSYALTVRATAGGAFAEATVTVNIGICDRTTVMHDLIHSRLGSADCESVTVADLGSFTPGSSINIFNFSGYTVGEVALGDFDGLINVGFMTFANNGGRLSVLPAGIFDDMTNLSSLILSKSDFSGNRLSSGVFDNLDKLRGLTIDNSKLDNLPADLFLQTNLSYLSLKDNPLTALPAGVFTGLTELYHLDLSGSTGAPFVVSLGVEQLEGSASSKVFQVRSLLPGPAYSEVAWEASGGSDATVTGTVTIAAGTATSTPFTVPAAAGHTTIALTGSMFNTATVTVGSFSVPSNFSGFTTTFAAALTVNVPVFGQSQGYVFDTLDSSSANGAILGTVSAMTTGSASLSDYTLTLLNAPYPTITFSIDSNGIIRYTGQGGLTPGFTLNLTVTATNASNNAAIATVTITVQGVTFTAPGPLFLPATERTTAVVIGTVVAADASSDVRYSLVTVVAATSAVPTADKFAIDSSGVVSYNGAATEDVTVNSGYTLTVRATTTIGAYTADAMVTVNVGICDRTAEIRGLIASFVGFSFCETVTVAALAGATETLSLNNRSLTSLTSWDVAGLSNLTALDLNNNQLGALPAGVFAGLSNLTVLDLSNTQLGTLPEGIFADLGNLTNLSLNNNQLSTFPAAVFADLSNLSFLNLQDNSQLSVLPAGVFDGLSNLEYLLLNDTSISRLREDVFTDLDSIIRISLIRDQLSVLPAGVFTGLSNLTRLELNSNQLSALPEDVFAGLTNLTHLSLQGNSVTFTVTFELEQLANNAGSPAFRVRSDFAGPAATVTYQLTGGGGGVASGSVQVPAGTTISSSFTVPAASGHTTVYLATSTLGTGFTGFNVELGESLTINAPAFEQPGGYVFHNVLLPTSVSGTVIGTVLATDPNSDPITYTIIDPDDGGNTFSISSDGGVITYTGTGNEPSGRLHNVIVTATNANDNTDTTVAVTVSVPGPPQFTATGPLYRTTDEVLGTVVAVDATSAEPLTYSLFAVAATSAVPTAGKFAIDPSSGVVSYTGAATEDVTVNSGYTLTIHVTTSNAYAADALVTVNIGICDRTALVGVGIASLVGATSCETVTAQALTEETGSLFLNNQNITSLTAWDFAGLSGLTFLTLQNNLQLSVLPAGVFAGLSNLDDLNLDGTSISGLREDVFTDLDNIVGINLTATQLSALPAKVFAGLGSLVNLRLGSNQLSALPLDVFADLGNLELLELNTNQLSVLPPDVFAGLTNLTTLNLQVNPKSDPVPFPVTFELEQLANNAGSLAFRVRSNFAGPAVAVTYRISGGGGASASGSVQVPAGTTISSSFTVPAASGHTTVSLTAGTLEANFFSGFDIILGAPLTINAPAFSAIGYALTLPENQSGLSPPGPYLLGTVTATDADGGVVTYSLSAGDTNRFSLDAANGEVSYVGAGEDFEGATASYALTVQARDNELVTTTVAVIITIGNENDPPGFATAYAFTLAENQSGAVTPVVIGSVMATDADGDGVTYSLASGDANRFSVDVTSGQVSYIGAGENHEGTINSYILNVQASDSALIASAPVMITVTDVADGPVFVDTPYSFSLAENRSGTVAAVIIGSVVATDDDGDAVTYTLTSGDASRFSLGATSGALSYIGSGEDFEDTPSYTLNVIAASGALTASVTVMVTVTDVADTDIAPAFDTAAYTFTLAENQSGSDAPVIIGSVRATDDDGDAVTYAFTTASTRFSLGATSGVLSYIGTGENFESAINSYILNVVASASSTLTASVLTASTVVTVAVTDVAGAPIFVDTPYSFSLAENQSGTVAAVIIGTVVTTVIDDANATYAFVTSTGSTLFHIGVTSGQVSYIGSGEDFESAINSYTLNVIAASGALSASAPVTVTVTNLDEIGAVQIRTEMTSMALAQVGRNIAIDTVDVLGGRFAAAPHVTISGRSLNASQWAGLTRWMQRDSWQRVGAWNGVEREINWDDIDLGGQWKQFEDRLLTGSSFLVSLGAAEGEASAGLEGWSLWGQGRVSGYWSVNDGMKTSGKVLSGYLGVDYQASEQLLYGVAVSHSQSDGYSEMATDGSNRIDIDTQLTGVYPYLQWSSGSGFEFWGTIGRGEGEVEVKEIAQDLIVADIELLAVGLGLSQRLVTVRDTEVTIKADGFLVQMQSDGVAALNATDSKSHRLRAALAGGQSWSLSGNARVFGGMELGARLDGGDGVGGQGLDMGANIGYVNPDIGLEAHSRVRFLVAHSEEYGDWGLDVTVRLQPPRRLGRGLSLSVAPGWGQSATAIDSLWKGGVSALKPAVGAGRGFIPDRTRFSLRYGLHYRGALWSPFAEAGMDRESLSALKLGLRMDLSRLRVEAFGNQDQIIGIEGRFDF